MDNKKQINVLVIDDDEDDFMILQDMLEEIIDFNYCLEWSSEYDASINNLKQKKYDICLLDYRLGEFIGLDVLKKMLDHGLNIPTILLTGQGDRNTDIEAMKLGAADYFVKGEFNASFLDRSIRYALERKKMDDKLRQANSDLRKNEESLRLMLLDLQKTHKDLKDTQSQLLHSEKMASIGQLAAGVAHEINNPVGFISNNIQVLSQYMTSLVSFIEMADNLKKEVISQDYKQAEHVALEINKLIEQMNLNFIKDDIADLLKESNRGIERIKKIVLDLRTFSRMEDDRAEPADLKEIVEGVLTIVQSEIKYKAEIKKEYGEMPPVFCYRQSLGQVVLNLLVNAAQAIEEKGIIWIKTYQKEHNAVIEVVDSGKGIPKDKLTKIFDPFYTSKAVGIGTGLGLSISYDIVEKHKGKITVASEEGKGTTFTVALPIENNK